MRSSEAVNTSLAGAFRESSVGEFILDMPILRSYLALTERV
jgi:hypothetical protein